MPDNNNHLILDSSKLMHDKMHKYWEFEEQRFLKNRRYKIRNRFDLIANGAGGGNYGYACMGDQIVEEIRDLFHNGFGIKWSEVQCEIFEMCLQACFPLIYGDDWYIF